MAETELNTTGDSNKTLIKWASFAIAILVIFLVGFIPMWMRANDYAAQTETAKKALTRSEISNLIATAIVDARRGEYESARQKTSDFYTKLDLETEKAETSAYPTAQNEKFKSVFKDRDVLITLLAQRDPASVERLTDIYMIYRQTVGENITKSTNQTAADTNSMLNSNAPANNNVPANTP
ncbi:MAG: hypothetical protein ABIP06_07675 [Pyrinomonadaceae bacterium]